MSKVPHHSAPDSDSPMLLPELRTERLLLRGWRDRDLEPLAALNRDPRVMEYFPHPLTEAESEELLRRIRQHAKRHGFGLWAVEVPGEVELVGLVGLAVPGFEAHFTPCVEVGWRLARPFWGRGYATEAATAALAYGFETLGLDQIVSFTTAGNRRSRRVMEKLGMTRDPADDFDHPRLQPGDPLRRHVLYRLRADGSYCG